MPKAIAKRIETFEVTDGTTTVSFVHSDVITLQYVPRIADDDAVYAKRAFRDGARLVGTSRQLVTESALIMLRCDFDTVRSKVGDLNQLLRTQAPNYHEDLLVDPVYVRIKVTGDSDTWRSLVYLGRAEWQDAALGAELGHKRWQIAVAFTRDPRWEGSQVELPLTNPSGTGTGGQATHNPQDNSAVVSASTISFDATDDRIEDSANGLGGFSVGEIISVTGSSNNDGSYAVVGVDAGGAFIGVTGDLTTEGAGSTIDIYRYDNYVDIDGDDVTGDLPGSLRVEVTRTADGGSNSSHSSKYFWLALTNQTDFRKLTYVYEGEDHIATGSVGSSAAASRGEYQDASWATGSGDVQLTTIPLDTDFLTAAGRAPFRLIIRNVFAFDVGATRTTRIFWRVTYRTTVDVLWAGERTYSNSFFDEVNLPPWRSRMTLPDDLTLQIMGERDASVTGGLAADLILALPIDAGFRWYESVGDGLDAVGERLVDDPADDVLLKDDGSSAEEAGIFIAFGNDLRLTPGKDHRLYMVHSLSSLASQSIDREHTIRLYYRPARETI